MENYKEYIEMIANHQDEIFNQELMMIEKEKNKSKLEIFLKALTTKYTFK